MLPAETLAQIFEYLSNEDIMHLPYRVLQNGLIKEEGLRRFKTCRVWLEKQSLYRLARISKHSIISKYVEELIFGIDAPFEVDLNNFIEYEFRCHSSQWDRTFTEEDQKRTTFKTFHELWLDAKHGDCETRSGWESLEAKYLAMKKGSKEGDKIRRTGMDRNILIMAFRNLSNARILSVDNFFYTAAERRRLGAGCFSPAILIGVEYLEFVRQDGYYLFTVLIEALAKSLSKPDVFQVVEEPAADTIASRDKRRLGISLSELAYRLPDSAYAAAFGAMKQIIFLGLEAIHEDYGAWKPLERILKSASSVVELTVGDRKEDAPTRETASVVKLPLGKCLGLGNHTQLQKLELWGFETRQWDMVKSLQAYALILKDLTLGKSN